MSEVDIFDDDSDNGGKQFDDYDDEAPLSMNEVLTSRDGGTLPPLEACQLLNSSLY